MTTPTMDPPSYGEKRLRKLEQRLNRIRNTTPGRSRILKLDEVASVLEFDSDELEALGHTETAAQMQSLALLVRRLEWDLTVLNEVVRGNPDSNPRKPKSRLDPGHWRGKRP